MKDKPATPPRPAPTTPRPPSGPGRVITAGPDRPGGPPMPDPVPQTPPKPKSSALPADLHAVAAPEATAGAAPRRNGASAPAPEPVVTGLGGTDLADCSRPYVVEGGRYGYEVAA